MIGVVANSDDFRIAEEFFQLFKTPWEAYQRDHAYEIVISTGDVPADCDCKLFVLYSSESASWEGQPDCHFRRRLRNAIVEIKSQKLPLYGDIATIRAPQEGALGAVAVAGDAEALGCESVGNGRKNVRLGYDLFREVAFLLTRGQPPENAHFATLDLHIEILRRLITGAGLAVVEIAPLPAGTQFISCLTHDIDFVSIRQHRFDRATWGFFYRATLGTFNDFVRGRCTLRKVGKNAAAALKWPLVQLGLHEDFWLPFGKYLEAEQGRPSTFFLIPFKDRCGKAPPGRDSKRRSVRYDVDDVQEWIPTLQRSGCEVAVHGIDAWNDRSRGREELDRIASRTGERSGGVRMHWLYFSEQSPQEIEAAGFDYDSTCGYNDAVGYRAGTSQVFQIPGTEKLLELPLHIQDTAMFFTGRMHLTEPEAWRLFTRVLHHCRQHGGVLTLLWHDRSLVPERLWNEFYAAVLKELSNEQTWFATARDVVGWFRKRRELRFRKVSRDGDQIEVSLDNVEQNSQRDMALRVTVAGNRPEEVIRVDVPLKGRSEITLTLPGAQRPVPVTAVSM